jgi:hypothetical protein
MTTRKRLGIWMDHSAAHLSEYSTGPMETKIIYSTFTHEDKTLSLGKGENLMHNKEQHRQSEYYKKLGEAIRNFEEVLLFGPTDAKVELLHLLRADHLFAKIKMEVRQTDKMTGTQQHHFIKEYFNAPGKTAGNKTVVTGG